MVLIVEGWRECTRISYTDSSAAYRCNHILGPILRFFLASNLLTDHDMHFEPSTMGHRTQGVYSTGLLFLQCIKHKIYESILYKCTLTRCTHDTYTAFFPATRDHQPLKPLILRWSWFISTPIKAGSTTSKANSVPEMSDLSSRKKAIGKAWTLFDSLEVNGDHTISLEDRGSRARVRERRWDIHVQLQS